MAVPIIVWRIRISRQFTALGGCGGMAYSSAVVACVMSCQTLRRICSQLSSYVVGYPPTGTRGPEGVNLTAYNQSLTDRVVMTFNTLN